MPGGVGSRSGTGGGSGVGSGGGRFGSSMLGSGVSGGIGIPMDMASFLLAVEGSKAVDHRWAA